MDTDTQPTSTETPPSSKKWLVALVAAVVIAGGGWVAWKGSNLTGKVLGADTSYQAIFLTNGQVYFGKLHDQGSWMELTDIYYLQVTPALQQASTSDQAKDATPTTPATTPAQPNIQLIKLGSELHGPTDSMHLDRDKILFWENMKDDSKVVQAINQYKAK